MELKIESTLRCPHCGHMATERMPENACQYYYDCRGCGRLLKPQPGDCCVFCSYGDTPCPPIQLDQGCCHQGQPGEP
ncbi:GDCCVxC domain-containing (seleno)protein [Motiliproteus sp. SC1-56]|uniref:GDCCVxC domain-containing (seleno)protein n=1 Tax=Motiliproteus sp. SC1-56 TaxID=2799565 RepID=UPI001A8DDD8B|nr:GDCCVxC domain-containing (seleno)protein [Motiliproteus sp. SC1-56]